MSKEVHNPQQAHRPVDQEEPAKQLFIQGFFFDVYVGHLRILLTSTVKITF